MAIARISPTDPPSAEQLTAQRATRFHQDGDALLTVETVRAWLTRVGLALYLPRPEQLPAPAPSFVEATLGAATPEPTPDQLEQSRGLLARLISEGTCVPLNLLGATGASGTDTPDFVCSPAVFSFLFTLRGNKAWKVAPVTSGPIKVSPLALATYELLTAKVTLSAYDLTTQLGKEVTEAAVLRSLTELWQQLRVIPVPQTDGSATLWELSTARFTKQIKAGANAGQPTALSALISLYLNQSIAATEDEVETFLSPLAPRSRLRSIVHDLIAARQLETIVIDGKTLVHISGDLPAFTAGKTSSPQAASDSSAEPAGDSVPVEISDDGSRIRKFTANPAAKLGTGLRARPAFGGKPGFGKKPAFGGKPAYDRPAGDRDRRPFDRDARPSRPAFNKPWDEERAARHSASGQGAQPDGIAAASGETSGFRERPAFRPKPAFGAKPAFRDNPAYRDRPERPRREFGSGDSRPPRREFGSGDSRPPRPGGFGARPSRPFGAKPGYAPRESSDAQDGGAPRRTFSKPGTFGRKREGAGGFPSSEGRPPRRDFNGARPSADRPYGDRPSGGFKRPGSFTPRPERSGPGEGGFARRSDSGPREGGFAGRKPFTPRAGGDRPPYAGRPSFGGKPSFSGKPSFPRPGAAAGPEGGGEAPRKTFRKFDAPRAPKPFGAKRSFDGPRSSGPPQEGGANRPSGAGRPSFDGGKRPSTFAGKGGPFAKFADGKKPFRKPGKPSSGGFAPVRRKRPDEEA